MVLMETSLATIASSVPGVIEFDNAVVAVADVTHDSRRAGPGVMFVAIEGASTDGHGFIDAVALAGSPAAMVGHRCDTAMPQLVVEDPRAAMAHLSRFVHGNPDTAMTTIGITGTNGKTTVSAMCESILAAAGKSVGVIGTLGARIDGAPEPLDRTTPESTDLFRLLATMRDARVDVVVMEVSSHALALHRADALMFDVVAFTNLSQDHLDFHLDMESYYLEKRKLFVSTRAKAAVINISDAAGARLVGETDVPSTTVALDTPADLVARIGDQGEGFTQFQIDTGGGTIDLEMPLPGWFNVVNALVAVGICRNLGIVSEATVAGLASLKSVPGRMELVDTNSEVAVIVDYAHTPDAVETVVSAARDMTTGRVIAVVGAGGDRDADKRPLMGAAAARHADVTIVTTDNPRSEDPALIAAAVEKGAISVSKSAVRVVLDRREAIAEAVRMADQGDLVLILGKGHEEGQEIRGVKLPFNDALVAAESLATREVGP